MFWVQFLIALAFQVVGELLRPKPRNNAPRPTSLGDYRAPTADESRPIPVAYGTVKVSGANAVWWGDFEARAITKKVKTGLFSSDRITLGYQYWLGLQLALTWGTVDELIGLSFDDKPVTLLDRVNGADVVTFRMDAPQLFSSDDPNNGVRGPVKFYRGTFNQVQNEYLATQFGAATIPAYRGICYAVFEKCYLSNNDSVPPVSWIIRRTPNTLGLTGGRENINGDANPACAIFEIMTNTFWGASIPQSAIDVPSFVAAANTLHAEGLGISMLIDSAGTADAISAEILRHIDGVVFIDPKTGLFTMKLARNDYVVASLPEVNPSNVEASSFKYTRGSWDETKNTVKIKYIDRAQNYTERVVQHQNLANITARGGQVDADDFDFSGLSNPTAANAVAARVLKTVSSPLSRVECEINRTLFDLRPGSVFRLSWPALGIAQIVYRAVEIDYGTLESGRIRVRAVEDVFSVAAVSFIDPPNTGWTNPLDQSLPLARQSAFEVPFGMIAPEAGEYIVVTGSPASGPQRAYTIWQDTTGGSAFVEQSGSRTFTPSGTLASDLPGNTAALITTGVTINNPLGMFSLASATQSEFDAGEVLARIVSAAGEEIVAWRTITDNLNGTYTLNNILRGQYDTVPLNHPAGAVVWFITDGIGLVSDTPYTTGITNVTLRATPFGVSSKLPLASATTMTVTLTDRAGRPYPPGNLRLNGNYLPSTISGALTVAWSPRNRLTQARLPYSQTGADVTAEASTTHTVRFYGETGTLLRTYSGLATLTQTWDTEQDDSSLATVAPGADATRQSLLHFDGPNNGTSFGDDAGLGWTVVGGAVITTAQARFGTGSGDFNGSRYIAGPVSPIWAPGLGDFTVSGWIRPTATPPGGVFRAPFGNWSGGQGWCFFQGSDNRLYFNLNSGGVSSPTPALTLNTWQHVAFVRAGGVGTLYVNGVAVGSGTVNTSLTKQTGMAIGRNDVASDTFVGQIDEFSFQNVAAWTANFTPPTAPAGLAPTAEGRSIRDNLIHYYPLDEQTSPLARDVEPQTPLELTAGNSPLFAQATIRSGGTRSIAFQSTQFIRTAVPSLEVNTLNRVSLSAWIRLTTFSTTTNGIISTTDGGETEAGNIQFGVYVNTAGRLVYQHEYGSGVDEVVTASGMTPLVVNTNYHVVVTRDSVAAGGTNTVRFYVNGVLVDTQNYVNARTGGTNANMRMVLGNGSLNGTTANSLNGRLQDVMLTSDLITDTEAAWLFNGGAGRSPADILGVVRRLNTQVTVEVDTVRSGVTSRVPARWTVSRPGGV